MALTERGTQRIEIIVRKAGSGLTGAKEKDTENANSQQNQQSDEQKQGTSSIKTSAFWRTQITHSAAVAKQMATQWFGYYVAGIGYKYGDQSLQQGIERQIEQITDTTNIATSIAMGATYGSMGGPLGMALGALMMGAQTASSTLLKYQTRQREYDVEVFKQNNAVEYKRARAQINLSTGRLR